jgi:hypothetical protein
MSEFKSPNFRNEDGSAAPDIVGVTTFTSPYYFVPPSGTTAERPSGDGLAPGMLRFNTDIGRLEVWRNDHWATILGESPNLGNQLVTNSAGGTGARAIRAMGSTSPGSTGGTNTIDYFTISTLGNAQNFGDINSDVRGGSSSNTSSLTRGLFMGGGTPTRVNTINYITISSTGDSQDFGDLTVGMSGDRRSGSNQTRAILFGGTTPSYTNTINYVTTASTGNASDFGDVDSTNHGETGSSGASSSVRIVMFGGFKSPAIINAISYVTISTTGDTQDFGDLSTARSAPGSCSSATRAISGGGSTPSATNQIEFVTMSTLGNAQDFGDLLGSYGNVRATSSKTRGVFVQLSSTNAIEYVTIQTTGNSLDFGDLTESVQNCGTLSNAHGGL